MNIDELNKLFYGDDSVDPFNPHGDPHMRRTTKIQRTSFLLSGNELTRVLAIGIGKITDGEDLGSIVDLEFSDNGDGKPQLDVTYHKEIK